MNIQGWFPLGLIGWISLLSKGFSRVFSSTFWKHQFFDAQRPLWPNSHICTCESCEKVPYLYWKNHSLTRQTFVGQVMSMIFNTLSKFVIAFLSRSKRLLILWLQSLSTVILDPKKIKSATVFIFPHLFAMKWQDWKAQRRNNNPVSSMSGKASWKK